MIYSALLLTDDGRGGTGLLTPLLKGKGRGNLFSLGLEVQRIAFPLKELLSFPQKMVFFGQVERGPLQLPQRQLLGVKGRLALQV